MTTYLKIFDSRFVKDVNGLYWRVACLSVMVTHTAIAATTDLLYILPPWKYLLFFWPAWWTFHGRGLNELIIWTERRLFHCRYWVYGWCACGTVLGHMEVRFYKLVQIPTTSSNGDHSMCTWETFELPLEAWTCTPLNINSDWGEWVYFVYVCIWLADIPRPACFESCIQAGLHFGTNCTSPSLGCHTTFGHLPH